MLVLIDSERVSKCFFTDKSHEKGALWTEWPGYVVPWQNVQNKQNHHETLSEVVLEKATGYLRYLTSFQCNIRRTVPGDYWVFFLSGRRLRESFKMNSFNAPTTQINAIDKMTTVKCKSVDLEGYVIIVVQTKDNKVKLYGESVYFSFQYSEFSITDEHSNLKDVCKCVTQTF